jgi:hypothetical protein
LLPVIVSGMTFSAILQTPRPVSHRSDERSSWHSASAALSPMSGPALANRRKRLGEELECVAQPASRLGMLTGLLLVSNFRSGSSPGLRLVLRLLIAFMQARHGTSLTVCKWVLHGTVGLRGKGCTRTRPTSKLYLPVLGHASGARARPMAASASGDMTRSSFGRLRCASGTSIYSRAALEIPYKPVTSLPVHKPVDTS